jgi:sugar phosphate isomerase/epimerase
MEEDTLAALRMLKEVGFDFVETNDRDFTRISMDELVAALREVDLPVAATHVGFETIKNTPQLAADQANALGAKYAILSWTPDEYRTTAGYKEMAAHFNDVGDVMLANGLRYAYHNHHFEFWKIDGPRNGMEIYLEETDPTKVWFELDLFWSALGRQDAGEFFERYPGRFKLCHIKDMNTAGLEAFDEDGPNSLDFDEIHKGLMVNVGDGDLPFERWLQMKDVSGMEYLIVEHDAPPEPLRKSVARSLSTVRGYSL